MTVLRSGSATDVGRVRSTNQDVALEDPDLFAVADGMGGAVGGDVAARLAVDALRAAFQREPSVEGLRHAIAEANRAVWQQGQSEAGLRGMGTTLTATGLVQESGGRQVVALANVGDSRAYVFSRGQVLQVTADHSVAEEKVRLGELTEAEAAVHPHRHILTRVLGVNPDVDVDLWELHLKHGDRILLCSDGLTNEIGDDRIRSVLGSVANPRDAAAALVRAAVDHGGSDNVTVVVIDVDDSASTAGATPGTGAPAGAVASSGPALAGRASARATQAAAPTAAHPVVPRGAAEPGEERIDEGAGAPGGPPSGREQAQPDGSGSTGLRRVFSGAPESRALARTGGSSSGSGAVVSALSDRRDARSGSAGRVFGLDDDDTGTDGGGLPSTGPATSLGFQAAELRRWQPSRRDRRQKRRSAGVPRLVTVRLVLFLVLVAAVIAGAYALVRWYAMDNWYVGLDHQHLAVYQGRQGGFLWFKPQMVDESPVTIHEVPQFAVSSVRHGRQEPSLGAARRYVTNIHQEYLDTRPPGTGSTTANAATGGAGSPGAGSASTTGTAP